MAYLVGLWRARGDSSVSLTVKVRAIDPTGLVDYAGRMVRHRGEQFDEIYCVVDVDEFDIATAVRTAANRGIELAVSNPCFELWLLLHHEDCTAYVDGYAAVVRRLRKHLPAYAKADLDFADFADSVAAAIERAKALEAGRNPSTTIWLLVERIVERR